MPITIFRRGFFLIFREITWKMAKNSTIGRRDTAISPIYSGIPWAKHCHSPTESRITGSSDGVYPVFSGRYKKPKSLKELPGLQGRILHQAAQLVKPGGRLVYSTCTLNPEENGKVADEFLKEHPEFVPAAVKIPSGMSRAIQEPENHFTMTPFACGTDGFFIAVFQKVAGE